MKVYLAYDCYDNGVDLLGAFRVKKDAIEEIEFMLSSYGYNFTPDTEGYVEVDDDGNVMHWSELDGSTVAKLVECEF